jgi:hypothetical protein
VGCLEHAENKKLPSVLAGDSILPGCLRSPLSAERQSSVRTLKIEADGDPYRGLIKPKIRLMGRWLEEAGFAPGHRVQVKRIAPGVIEVRSSGALDLNGTPLSSIPRSDNPF